ncbi:hypothetical protein CK203_084351 [Vitis vinifera]|uniref:Uncharacterized protein n=1 Tax=Vitis vinifera TaxID=29760 RepID=A0A438DF46_VITVI|nr:hypothetical protein CK203_084351 [Vitis vinifera]
MAAKKTVSSSRASEVRGKAIDKLDAKEFWERFSEERTIIFFEGTIQRGAPVSSAGVVQGVPPFHPDSTRLYSPQHRPGADGMQHRKNDIFSMSAHLPSLQLVTELPDSTKGGATGHVVVRGAWAGLLEHPARPFTPNYSLEVPGRSGIEGPPCGLGGKASFDRLSKLFEIDAKERQYAKGVVPGEHYIVKDLPIYEASKEADAGKRRLLLEDRDKKKNEGTLRRLPDRNATQTLLHRKIQQKGGSW